jgi:hypothetical protein
MSMKGSPNPISAAAATAAAPSSAPVTATRQSVVVIFAEHFQTDGPKMVNNLLGRQCNVFCHELSCQDNVDAALTVAHKGKIVTENFRGDAEATKMANERVKYESELISILQRIKEDKNLRYQGVDMARQAKGDLLVKVASETCRAKSSDPIYMEILELKIKLACGLPFSARDQQALTYKMGDCYKGQLKEIDDIYLQATHKVAAMRDITIVDNLAKVARSTRDNVVCLLGPFHVAMLDNLAENAPDVYANTRSFMVCTQVPGVSGCTDVLTRHKAQMEKHHINVVDGFVPSATAVPPATRPVSAPTRMIAGAAIGFFAGGPIVAGVCAIAGYSSVGRYVAQTTVDGIQATVSAVRRFCC